ncbi:MAG: cellulose biosynthesis cyclic di-GMP-binding regulatory protein BcsB [Ghiorsea sp.]|nr:cellulose biosynthesis cyclic di-GMP-binding regulatory protein BcsB [Ghiorsea sp.]
MKIYRNPKDVSKYILIVAGKDDSEVLAMARYLAEINLEKVEGASVTLAIDANDLVVKINKKYTGVSSNMSYTFAQLGMKTKVLTGIDDAAELQLKLPADLFAIRDEDIDVMLHLTYSAFLGEGSSIAVLLNGEFQHSVLLNNPSGMHVNSWKLSFPLRSFKRGLNTIRFQGHIAPSVATKEHQHMIDSIKVTLFGDSIVRIPSMAHYSKLPNLGLLKDTGYPYIESGKSIFYVKKGGDEHLSSALTLVAKLAQQKEQLINTISLSNSWVTHKDENLFMFTDFRTTSVRMLKASPLNMIDGDLWLPMSDAFGFAGIPGNILTPILSSDLVLAAFLRMADTPVLQQLDLSSHGVLSQFESPFVDGKTVTLLISKTPALLEGADGKLSDAKSLGSYG